MDSGDKVHVPERRLLEGGIWGNKVVQVASAATSIELGMPITSGAGQPARFACSFGDDVIAVLNGKPCSADGYVSVLAPEPSPAHDGTVTLRWISSSPSPIKPKNDEHSEERRRGARASWQGRVTLVEERSGLPGLRPPQVGAVYGVLSHWKSSDSVATVVMPTGTGKTEVMLTLLVHE